MTLVRASGSAQPARESSRPRIGERAHSSRRRRFLLLATAIISGAVAGGCSSNSAVATGPTQLKCQVTLAVPASSIGSNGGMGSITVTTSPECPWEVSTGSSWLSGLSPTSGQGTGSVEFRAAPNPLPSVREGEIVVNESRVRVSQQAACRLELRPGFLTIDAGGGTREIAVSAPSACSWTAAADADWISFTTPVTRSGNGSVGISIAPHRGQGRREGTIVVGDQSFTVTQQPGAPGSGCVYLINSTSQGVLPSGGADVSASVTVASGCAWTASSDVAWVTVVAGARGTGSGSVAFRVAANPGGVRTGTVTVAGQTVTVTQVAATANPCSYTIGAPDVAMAAQGGTGTVAVSTSAGCAWTASSNVAWVTVASGASGAGNGRVAFSVAANPGAARTGTVTVAGQTFTVTQEASVCTYSINPTSITMSENKATSTVTVSAGAGCAWTAKSNAKWIDVKSGASGNGGGSVTFEVGKNDDDDDRTGTLTIAGRAFTVRQQGKDD